MWSSGSLSTFTPDSSCELDILGHDCYSLGVDGTQVSVFEKTDEISLTGFLKSHDSRALESEIGLEILSDFTNQTLEGQLPDQKFGALLVTTDFSQSDSSGPISVWFLHTSCCWGTLASSLGCQLFSWGFATGRFTCGLLSSCHVYSVTSQSEMKWVWWFFWAIYPYPIRFAMPMRRHNSGDMIGSRRLLTIGYSARISNPTAFVRISGRILHKHAYSLCPR